MPRPPLSHAAPAGGQRKGVRYFRILSSVNSIIYFLLKVREKLSLFYYTIYGFLHGIPFPIHDFHPHRSPRFLLPAESAVSGNSPQDR